MSIFRQNASSNCIMETSGVYFPWILVNMVVITPSEAAFLSAHQKFS